MELVKSRKKACIIAFFVLLVIAGLLVVIVLCTDLFHFDEDLALTWDESQSHFSGYSVEGEIVEFQYTVCFVNLTDEASTISVGAFFKRSELKNWVVSEDDDHFFFAVEADGNLSEYTIPPNSRQKVTLTFRGKYLGGEVNTELSFPEELMIELILPENGQ